MAGANQFPIDIVIKPDAKGSLAVNSQLKGIQTQARATARAVGGILAAFVGGAGAFSFVSTLSDFSDAMARVKAISGATETEFRALREEAKRLGSTTEFTATQAGQGLVFLSQAGFTAAESVKGLEDTLNLATIGAIGMAESADFASNVLTGFGLEVEELTRVVDVMALTATSSNTDITQLGQAMSYTAPIASSLKVSVEETSAAIGILGNAGIQASRAGTSLNAVFARLASGRGRYFKRALDDLGLSMEDISIKTHGFVGVLENLEEANIQMEHAMALVGREAGGAFLKLVENVDEVRDLTDELNEANGAAERIARTARDSLKGSLDALKSAWEGLLIAVGDDGAESALRGTVDAMVEGLRYLGENVDLVTNSFEALAYIVGGKILISSFGALTGLVTGLAGGLVKLATGGIVGGIASIAGSLGSIAAISGGLIAALTAFRDTFVQSDSEAIRNLGSTLQAMIDTIEELISYSFPEFTGFSNDFDGLLNQLAGGITSLIEVLFQVSDQIGAIVNSLPLYLPGADVPQNVREEVERRQRYNEGLQQTRSNLITQHSQASNELEALEGRLPEIDTQIRLIRVRIRGFETDRQRLEEAGINVARRLRDSELDLNAAYFDRDRILEAIAGKQKEIQRIGTQFEVARDAPIAGTSAASVFRDLYGTPLTDSFRKNQANRIAETERNYIANLLNPRLEDSLGANIVADNDNRPRESGLTLNSDIIEFGAGGRRRSLLSAEELGANIQGEIDRSRELATLSAERAQIQSELNAISDQYAQNQIAFSDEIAEGYRAQLTEIQSLQRQFNTLSQVGTNTFKELTDGLIQWTEDGKYSIKDFTEFVLNEFQRIAAAGVVNSLSTLWQGVLTNIFGGVDANAGFRDTFARQGTLGLNTGGVITVGGRGGTDQNVLGLNGVPVARVSKGEKIPVLKNGEGSGKSVVINNYTTINAETGSEAEIATLLDERDEKLKQDLVAEMTRNRSIGNLAA